MPWVTKKKCIEKKNIILQVPNANIVMSVEKNKSLTKKSLCASKVRFFVWSVPYKKRMSQKAHSTLTIMSRVERGNSTAFFCSILPEPSLPFHLSSL